MYGSFFGKQEQQGAPASSSSSSNGTDHPSHQSLGTPPISPKPLKQPLHKLSSNESAEPSSALLPPSQSTDSSSNKATVMSCIINLANTIVGAGMLGLPGAFGGTGYVGGTILIVLGAFFSAQGLWLLSRAAQRAGLPSSFYSVASAAVPQYTILIDLAVALKCFGVATGYLITVGDCMVDALDHILLSDKNQEPEGIVAVVLSRQFWVVGAILAVLPVSFYRTLDDLKKASALALIFVFFLAFGIIAYANGVADPCLDTPVDQCRGEIRAFTDIPTTVSKLPIFVFAFTCHQNIFPVVNELQHRTQRRLNLVIGSAIGFALLLFYTVAMQGYQTFGSLTRGDVVLNYPETQYVTALRICIAFMLALHYPLQLDPSRRCIRSLIHVVQKRYYRNKQTTTNALFDHRESDDLEAEEPTEQSSMQHDPSSNNLSTMQRGGSIQVSVDYEVENRQRDAHDDDDKTQFYTVTIAFLLCSFSIAMMVDDLGVVLAMVGATGSTLVSYVLPGLIYLKIHPFDDVTKRFALLQLSLGCLIMPLALYFVVMGRVRE